MRIIRLNLAVSAIWILVALIVGVGLAARLVADELVADPSKAEAQVAAERSTAELELWKFRLTKDPNREMTFDKKSILRWTNPTVGRVYGNVYVITSDGRPQALLSPYKWFKPYRSLEVECASLATSGIEAVRDGKTVWSTPKPGVEWKPVPGSPAVGKSPTERQRQMKQLAQHFTAELVDTRSNGQGEDQQLRQLTQPIYRFESANNRIVDGGIFVYVIGTDPEVFLILEAVDADDASHWQFALTRMNSDRITIKFQSKEVFAFDKLPYDVYRDHKQPYFGFLVSEE